MSAVLDVGGGGHSTEPRGHEKGGDAGVDSRPSAPSSVQRSGRRRGPLEAAETTMAACKSQWAAREKEAAGEIERLEAERRSLIVSESDAQAQNVRLQIELRAMRHSGWDQGGPPLQELRAASMAASSSADAGPLGSYATPMATPHTLKLDELSGSSVSPPTKDLHAS